MTSIKCFGTHSDIPVSNCSLNKKRYGPRFTLAIFRSRSTVLSFIRLFSVSQTLFSSAPGLRQLLSFFHHFVSALYPVVLWFDLVWFAFISCSSILLFCPFFLGTGWFLFWFLILVFKRRFYLPTIFKPVDPDLSGDGSGVCTNKILVFERPHWFRFPERITVTP